MVLRLLLLITYAAAAVLASPAVYDAEANVTYLGFTRNGVEIFLGIPYAQDTGGPNRFKPPQPFSFPQGTTVNATDPGPACPQPLGQWNAPLTLLNVTSVSEDCLNLNIVRPANASHLNESLPVMVWIHGGRFKKLKIAHRGTLWESIGEHSVIYREFSRLCWYFRNKS